ncbi:MAG: MarR family transcriptional regulator [Clostridia bacterium]|nr:MarR family transcriptional regulator [Clostridia bacterium]
MKERFETFTVLIAEINRSIKKLKNSEMAEYGLRSAHISCLYYLYLSDELTATDLCERCHEDKATVSRALDYLEDHDFIICESKSPKRYKSPITLTEKGRDVGKRIADRVNGVLDEISGVLTEDERVELYRSLSLINDALERCADRS